MSVRHIFLRLKNCQFMKSIKKSKCLCFRNTSLQDAILIFTQFLESFLLKFKKYFFEVRCQDLNHKRASLSFKSCVDHCRCSIYLSQNDLRITTTSVNTRQAASHFILLIYQRVLRLRQMKVS